MPSTNDFLSKPLIAIKEGKNCGIVTNMLFDDSLKTVTAVLVFDQIESTYNTLSVTKIKKMQNDAVVTDTAADVEAYDGKVFNPINFDVFDTNGKHLGIVSEIILTKSYAVKSIECRGLHLSPDKIYSHSDDTLVVKPVVPKQEKPSSDKKTSRGSLSQTQQKNDDGAQPEIFPAAVINALEQYADEVPDETQQDILTQDYSVSTAEEKPEETAETEFLQNAFENTIIYGNDNPSAEKIYTVENSDELRFVNESNITIVRDMEDSAVDNETITPPVLTEETEIIDAVINAEDETGVGQIGSNATITGTGSFLLGRRCDKNILNRYNEIIIKQGSLICNETIKTAKLNGKLLELSMHAAKQ